MSVLIRKRLLSILLVLTMVVSMFPTTFAEGEQTEAPLLEEEVFGEESSDLEGYFDTVESVDFEEPVEAEEPVSEDGLDETEEPADVEEPVETEESSDVEEPVDTEVPADIEEPAETEEPADTEEPGDIEEPAETEEPAGDEEAEEPEDGEEAEDAEDAEESEGDAPSLVVLHVVSEQPLNFVLVGPEGEISPVTEEEIFAFYFAESAETAAEDALVVDTGVAEDTLPVDASAVAEPVSAAEPSANEAAAPEAAAVMEAETAPVHETDLAETAATPYRADFLLLPGFYTWSASAEGFLPRENVSLEVSGDATLEIVLEAAFPYGFKGMPAGWTPSEADLAAKRDMVANNMVSTLEQMTPGIDYVEGEIIYAADSEEYARTVAEAYSAELEDYQFGLAKAELTTATVLEALTAAADPELALPAVEANLVSRLEPDWGEVRPEVGIAVNEASGVAAPSMKRWQDYSFSDPYLKNPTQSTYQYMHDVVNSYEAWGVTKGSGVTVAVIDTGVNSSHQDLSGAVSQAGSMSGYVGDHGTHVAGIIAARMNSYGGAGIAPEARILSIRIFESEDSGYENYDLATAIRTAANNGVKVINLSLGGTTYSSSVLSALKYAINTKGVNVVVSMGNYANNQKYFPAAYDIPGLIAVGSVTEGYARSGFSNYGPWEDILAPGSAIMSTLSSGYGFLSGTSMSAPVVSGVCALYRSVYPTATPVQVEKAIKAAKTNGVIDASKLFVSDKTPPVIDAPTTVNYNSTIYIRPSAASHFVVYTTDGSAPTVKDGEVTVGTVLNGGYGVKVTSANGFSSAKKVTIKAISVSGMGVASKVTSKTVTVVGGPNTLAVSSLAITGQSTVSPGKSATYKVTVTPAKATNKTVTWSLSSYTWASINNGKLTVQAGAPDTTVTVYARANDGSGKQASFQVKIRPPITSLRLNMPSTPTGGSITRNNDGSPKQITMASVTLSGKYSNRVNLSTSASVSDTKMIWTSSNSKVAVVTSTGNQTASVTAIGAGTAVITAKADDGSGKSAKVSIKVSNPASGITVNSSSPTTYGSVLKILGVGKSVKNTAKVSDAFGKPSSAKVTWGKRVFYLYESGWKKLVDVRDLDALSLTNLTNLVSSGDGFERSYTSDIQVSNSGAVTAKKSMQYDANNYYVVVWVYATTTDGSNLSGGVMYLVTNLHTKLAMQYRRMNLSVYSNEYFYYNYIYQYGGGNNIRYDYTVKSSNPAVAGGTLRFDDYGDPFVAVTVTGQKKGSATITVTATDGSGKKASFTVKVS